MLLRNNTQRTKEKNKMKSKKKFLWVVLLRSCSRTCGGSRSFSLVFGSGRDGGGGIGGIRRDVGLHRRHLDLIDRLCCELIWIW